MNNTNLVVFLFLLIFIQQSTYANMYIVPDTGNSLLIFVDKNQQRAKIPIVRPREIIKGVDKGTYFVTSENKLYKIKDTKKIQSYSFISEVRGIRSFLNDLIIGVLKDQNKLFILSNDFSKVQYYNLRCTGPRQTYIQDQKIFIIGNSSNSVDIFNYQDQKIEKSFKTDIAPYSIFVDNNNIYIGSIQDETVVAYDKISLEIKWRTSKINHPTKIIEQGNLLYITNFDESTITSLDKETGNKVSVTKVKEKPFDIMIFDNNIFVLSNVGSLDIYDKSFNLIKSIGGFKNIHHFQVEL